MNNRTLVIGVAIPPWNCISKKGQPRLNEQQGHPFTRQKVFHELWDSETRQKPC